MTPLPPLKYTIEDFEKWCTLCGHHQARLLFSNFRKFCNSDYCKNLLEPKKK